MTALMQPHWALGLTLLALLSAGPASAATLDVYTFDENGHGSVTFADGRVLPLVSLIDFDPDPFLNGVKTLSYQLFNVPLITEGFVLLHESTDSCFSEICSDVLHFSRITNSVFFYSDQEPGGPSDLADNAAALSQAVTEGIRTFNTVIISEVGAEGANGAVYTALEVSRGAPSCLT
jgi:hypothetical protein